MSSDSQICPRCQEVAARTARACRGCGYKFASAKVGEDTEGIMFYSPSTVQSYILENPLK